MKIEVVPAKHTDHAIVGNLLQFYLHDFSEFDGSNISSDGRFQYPYLSLYWKDPDRHPFLIMVDDSLAGFALLKRGSEMAGDKQSMDVAEFFVLRSQRWKGIGRAAFRHLVRMFPGSWIVRVQEQNPAALEFWKRAIPGIAQVEIEQETVEYEGRSWVIFRFAVA